MNSKQFQSLARWLINAAAGGVIAYTNAKSPAVQGVGAYVVNLINGPDVAAGVTLALTWLWGHLTHRTASSTVSGTSNVVGVLVTFAAASMLFTGCASTPNKAAYQTVGTTIVSVDTAMHMWGAYVAVNHPSADVEKKVRAAYEKYQAAAAVVCDAGAVYASGISTNSSVITLLNIKTAMAQQALVDLENLLTSIGVQLTNQTQTTK